MQYKQHSHAKFCHILICVCRKELEEISNSYLSSPPSPRTLKNVLNSNYRGRCWKTGLINSQEFESLNSLYGLFLLLSTPNIWGWGWWWAGRLPFWWIKWGEPQVSKASLMPSGNEFKTVYNQSLKYADVTWFLPSNKRIKKKNPEARTTYEAGTWARTMVETDGKVVGDLGWKVMKSDQAENK